jgi:hypothetical protein
MNKLPQSTAKLPQEYRNGLTAKVTAKNPIYKGFCGCGTAVAVAVRWKVKRMKRRTRLEAIMSDDRTRQERLFKYLLWGMTTTPARFRMLSEFQAWVAGLGFDADECRICWNDLRSIYRSLFGEPVFEEVRQAA